VIALLLFPVDKTLNSHTTTSNSLLVFNGDVEVKQDVDPDVDSDSGSIFNSAVAADMQTVTPKMEIELAELESELVEGNVSYYVTLMPLIRRSTLI